MKKLILLMTIVSSFGHAEDRFKPSVQFPNIVNEHRDSLLLVGRNLTEVPTICDFLEIKVQLEDMRTNSPIGSIPKYVSEKYLYPKSDNQPLRETHFANTFTDLTSGRDFDAIIVPDSNTVKANPEKCAKADFQDYCLHAQMDPFEMLAIAQLGQKYGRMTCSSLFEKIKRKKKIDVSDSLMIDFRWARHLPRLKKIDVTNTYKDRSGYLEKQKRIKRIGDNSRPTSDVTNIEDHMRYLPHEMGQVVDKFEFNR